MATLQTEPNLCDLENISDRGWIVETCQYMGYTQNARIEHPVASHWALGMWYYRKGLFRPPRFWAGCFKTHLSATPSMLLPRFEVAQITKKTTEIEEPANFEKLLKVIGQ